MRYLTIFFLVFCLSGCANSATVVPSSQSGEDNLRDSVASSAMRKKTSGTLTLSVKTNVQSRGTVAKHWFQSGETLHSGDGLAFHIHLNAAAYLYVVGYSATGWSVLHYPSLRLSEHQLVSPGETRRVPAGELRLYLDDKIGEEIFLFIASRHPIDAQTCSEARHLCPLWQDIDSSRRGDKQKVVKPPPPAPPPQRPPPPGLTADKRSDRASALDPGVTLSATSLIRQDILLLRWAFNHER